MGWLSATALRLDRAEIESRRQAVVEEKVRLALWRMDSALAPMVAQESARPYFAYLAYFPADRSFNRMFNTRTKGETLIASPLLMETPPRILLHFQFDEAGNLTSPQLPPVTRIARWRRRCNSTPQVQRIANNISVACKSSHRPEKLAALLAGTETHAGEDRLFRIGANEQQRKTRKLVRRKFARQIRSPATEYAQRMQAVQQQRERDAAESSRQQPVVPSECSRDRRTSPQGTAMPQETNANRRQLLRRLQRRPRHAAIVEPTAAIERTTAAAKVPSQQLAKNDRRTENQCRSCR